MAELKIFISCHKPSFVPAADIFVPVQAGSELSSKQFAGMLHDNEGCNISDRNKTYCELTVQYWAWKNAKADYYGFFHYRRYLSFQNAYPVDERGRIRENYPLPYEEIPDIKDDMTRLGYTKEHILNVVEQYDVVSIIRERSNFTAYEQYCQFHFQQDLDRMLEILKDMYPQYVQSADKYMCSKEIYFMNMYIMKRNVFFEYMEWLFPLLEEYERRADFSGYSEAEQRATAYLAERLFGIYYTHLKDTVKVHCCELPYVVFGDTEPKPSMRPIFSENQVAIVLASNRDFVPYLSVMLRSIIDCSTNDHNYDIIILHRDIEKELQEIVANMANGKINLSIRFCDCSSCVKEIPFKVHHHFSVETFYRYFILDLLEGYEKTLYLDADMVVLRDVAELYEMDTEGCFMAAVKDMDVIGTFKSDEYQRKYMEQVLRLLNPLDYFQAGVLIMNLKEMRRKLDSRSMVELTVQREWQMVDQDVLNVLCEGEIRFLPQRWNVLINWRNCGKSRMDRMKNAPYSLWCEYQEARKNPCIIHYAGGWKPWNTPCCDYGEYFWDYAKRTPFYEEILCDNQPSLAYKNVVMERSGKRTFRLRPTRMEIILDMKKLNRILPAGSRRRMFVRGVFKRCL